jgi:hypothetical protein
MTKYHTAPFSSFYTGLDFRVERESACMLAKECRVFHFFLKKSLVKGDDYKCMHLLNCENHCFKMHPHVRICGPLILLRCDAAYIRIYIRIFNNTCHFLKYLSY